MNMSKNSNCDPILEKMYGLRRFGIKLGLSAIRDVLEELGDPHRHFSSIHIAGTNGKGSVASTLSMILSMAGHRTGLYTSPHLVRFNERICIDNTPISDDDIVEAYHAVGACGFAGREPTFFEFTTAMAFYIFKRENVKWAVVETGMGGRLDATNVIAPRLSIITNISIEHRQYLGNTISEIAAEKGGIIKPGIPVATGVKQASAVSVLNGIAQEKGSPLYRYGSDFKIRRHKDGSFTYYGLDNVWRNLRTGLPGGHQVDNAALILAGCELLNRDGAGLESDHINEGFKRNNWPGRLEVACESPYIILDGAHNIQACRNLAVFLRMEKAKKKRIVLVVGILDDKPYKAMLGCLLPECDHVIVTRPVIDRALSPETLAGEACGYLAGVEIFPDVARAVKHAVETAGENDLICIGGSLYVVGEAKTGLEKIGIKSARFGSNIPA